MTRPCCGNPQPGGDGQGPPHPPGRLRTLLVVGLGPHAAGSLLPQAGGPRGSRLPSPSRRRCCQVWIRAPSSDPTQEDADVRASPPAARRVCVGRPPGPGTHWPPCVMNLGEANASHGPGCHAPGSGPRTRGRPTASPSIRAPEVTISDSWPGRGNGSGGVGLGWWAPRLRGPCCGSSRSHMWEQGTHEAWKQ